MAPAEVVKRLVQGSQVFIEEAATHEDRDDDDETGKNDLTEYDDSCLTSADTVNAHQSRHIDDKAKCQEDQGNGSSDSGRKNLSIATEREDSEKSSKHSSDHRKGGVIKQCGVTL